MVQVHPVLTSVETIASALKDVADVDPAFMSTQDKKAALLGLSRLLVQVEQPGSGASQPPTMLRPSRVLATQLPGWPTTPALTAVKRALGYAWPARARTVAVGGPGLR